LYELLTPYQTRVGVSPPDVCVGAISLFLGKLATLLERLEEAERYLKHAIELNLRMGGKPWAARAEYAYARLLVIRGHREDRERARELLTGALERGAEIRMEGLEREMADLVRELEVAPYGTRTTRTFLFTDIVRSTDLVAAMGDDAWVDLIRWHDQALRDLFASHSGREVDHAGDGFFVAFDDPVSAMNCAVAIQRRLRRQRREHGFAPQIRIGLHQAVAIDSGGEYKGKGVHEAARIASLAGGDEILMSCTSLPDGPFEHRLSEPREVVLKGVGKVEVVAVEWN
jgi:class 3 adenylate cyclase